MEGNLGPEEIRSRKFEIVRRGYDRSAVDRFKDEISVRVAAVETELATLREKLGQAGMDDVPDLKTELQAVSSEVAEVLESAREAAEGMRSRASADAARWRADADKEARALRTGATADSEQARRDAWEAGSELLRQSDAESKKILEEAHQAALFIRAEAEREALRLTGDARRDREESVRKSKTDADRLLMEARAESERILESARQSAQNAQERARALEQRRSELMQELEAARLSIGQMEQEIDSRREALQAAAEAPEAGVRVIKTPAQPPTEWLDDDASVRIVPASRVAPDEPVDADAFVAEVEEMQSAKAEPEEATPDEPEEAVEPELPADEVEAAEPEAADEDDADEPADESADESEEASAARDSHPEVAESEAEAPAPEPEEAPEPPEAPKPAEPAVPEGIDDLFAQLRTGDAEPEAEAGEAAGEAAAAAAEPEPEVVEPVEPEAEAPATPATAASLSGDPFELRDRLLLPIENRTLRSVKRRIVDLQNRVLEEIRVGDDDWSPDRSMFTAAVSEDVGRMNQESFVAGYAAAAELLGQTATPPPDRAAGQETSGDFVDGLIESVADALARTRSSGGGSRQISAAVGRVFRAWRTDEAARRLRRAGLLAYHEGLLGAYPQLGVERVMAVSPGTPCGQCPAGTDVTWGPGRGLPAGTTLPPAGPECRDTIVPAA